MGVNNVLVIPLVLLMLLNLFIDVDADCSRQCRDKRNYLSRFSFSQIYLNNIYGACMTQCSHGHHRGQTKSYFRWRTPYPPIVRTPRPTNPPVVWTQRPTNPPVVWTRRPTSHPIVVWTPHRTNPPVIVWTPKRTNPPIKWTPRRTNPPVVWTHRKTNPTWIPPQPTSPTFVWTPRRTNPPIVWTHRPTNPTWMPRTTPKINSQYGCGVKSRYSNRIIGGYPSEPCEYPWMVVVKTPGFFCGGSIIDKRHILTAAHCIKNLFSGVIAAPSQVKIKVGSSRQSRLRTLTAIKVHVHPKHNIYRDYDIAIVTLKRDLVFGPCVAPVCLPKESQGAEVMDECVVTGWGLMDPLGVNKHQPDVLMKVNVNIVSRSRCLASYGGRHFNDLKICAGNYRLGGKDSCKGDSGGPLLCRKKGGPYSVYGIVSFGNQCAKPLYPGVYTRVNHPFIKQYIVESTNDIGRN